MAGLNEKQKRFVNEYLIDLNATQAAIRAGYSKRTADSQASRLLANVKVRQYIDEKMAEKDKKLIADQDEILRFLTSVMCGEVEEPVAILDGNGYQDIRYVIPNAASRKSAAELLGKRYAMWTDKKQLEGNVGVTIIDDTGADDDE